VVFGFGDGTTWIDFALVMIVSAGRALHAVEGGSGRPLLEGNSKILHMAKHLNGVVSFLKCGMGRCEI
jgi:hypothetical protein